LPKKRGAVAPKGFTRRYGNMISARVGAVARDGLDGCVYRAGAPKEAAEPARRVRQAPARKAAPPPRALPGEEFEQPAVKAPPPAPEPEAVPAAEPETNGT
jgi:monofunctional biosynthetic peptidoglycan transglycosylase